MIGAITDVHERRQAEAEPPEARDVSASRTKAPMGIVFADAGGSCVYVNERWCQLTGITADAAMGEGWLAAVHPDDRDRVSAGLARRGEGAPRENPGIPVPDSGARSSMSRARRWLSTGRARCDGLHVPCPRRPARKRADATAANSSKMSGEHGSRPERASHLKDECLSTLSHELRSPSARSLGWTRLIRGREVKPRGRGRGLETIERITSRSRHNSSRISSI